MSKIIAHTTQDEGKKGVGMGELGMALIFKNVTDSRGKGDLALDGEEFEIKGNGATLGEKPDAFPVDMVKLEPFGIKRIGTKYEIGIGEDIEIVPNKNKFGLKRPDLGPGRIKPAKNLKKCNHQKKMSEIRFVTV